MCARALRDDTEWRGAQTNIHPSMCGQPLEVEGGDEPDPDPHHDHLPVAGRSAAAAAAQLAGGPRAAAPSTAPHRPLGVAASTVAGARANDLDSFQIDVQSQGGPVPRAGDRRPERDTLVPAAASTETFESLLGLRRPGPGRAAGADGGREWEDVPDGARRELVESIAGRLEEAELWQLQAIWKLLR